MAGLEDGEFADDLLIIDEADLGPTSFGPEEVESDSFLTDTEPHPDTQGESSESIDLPEFDPRFRQDFEGLLYLGYLEDDFHWMGHHFVLRTYNTNDVLEIGLLHAKYAGTMGDAKAWQALVCAASVVSVDGKSLPRPISNEPEDTELANKFRYILKWFPLTIDAVYEKSLELEMRVRQVLDAMGKASG